jgi:hypothetical protein
MESDDLCQTDDGSMRRKIRPASHMAAGSLTAIPPVILPERAIILPERAIAWRKI